jgi:enterochelin esterase-like enzyme
MKKLIFATLFIFIFITSIFAQNAGKTLESIKMSSKTLGKDAKYSIYLPPNYDQNQRTYPVVYLLHGYTGCETDWVQFGDLPAMADKAIAQNQIPPMIIVMPDAQNSWYVNSPAGNYEDFFIKEFIPYIDATYRTRAKKDSRALTGLSMGGNGSFMYAMKYPEMFGASVILSGAFWSNKISEERKNTLSNYFETIYGKDPANAPTWKENNPFFFLKKEKIKDYNSVKLLFDCGDDDFVINDHLELNLLLKELKINHELRIREGVHNWKFWRESITPALQFCGETFHH